MYRGAAVLFGAEESEPKEEEEGKRTSLRNLATPTPEGGEKRPNETKREKDLQVSHSLAASLNLFPFVLRSIHFFHFL